MGLEIAPGRPDGVEFGGVFRQPLGGEPVFAGGERGQRRLADVDRVIVEHENDPLATSPNTAKRPRSYGLRATILRRRARKEEFGLAKLDPALPCGKKRRR